ncbi:hypothetical protein HK102_009439 [Quaeritorhiza haematococci]|nr:hypothetical protein HK102_009439 [Quaeritorhiza haematococci]
MQRSGRGGVVLNVSSLAGLYPQDYQPVYAASKAGVIHFTRSLESLSYQTPSIRVNCICPSFSPTPLVQKTEEIYGEPFKAVVDQAMVPVEMVVDAMMRGIEDEGLAGAAIRVTPQFGIDLFNFRKSKVKVSTNKSKL